MAVVITNRGRLPSQREWEGTCSNCRTTVEFLQQDAFESGDSQRDGAYANVMCPLDGCLQYISGSLKARPPTSR